MTKNAHITSWGKSNIRGLTDFLKIWSVNIQFLLPLKFFKTFANKLTCLFSGSQGEAEEVL